MSVVLGIPGGPAGHFAKDHIERGTSSPAGIAGPLGLGESLGRMRNSASAALRSVDTAAKLLNALPPLSGRVNGVLPPKLRSENSVRIRSLTGLPRSIAMGKLTVNRLPPGAMSAPQPTQATTYPCRWRKPLPKSDEVVGLLLFAVGGVSFSIVWTILLPRLFTSKKRVPLAFDISTGRSSTWSAENSTLPAALRGALSRSNTTALWGLPGSASK